jgi:hypothetical protein
MSLNKIDNTLNLKCNKMSKRGKSSKRFLLLGDSGSGKSTFINYLTNFLEGEKDFDKIINKPKILKIAIPVKNWEENVLEKFKNHNKENNINDITTSQTTECFEYTFNSQSNISFIDSPGLNDTNGCESDIKNMRKIIEAVTKEKILNGIILLVNGTMPRLSTSMSNFISMLKSFLPVDIIKNVRVVLTNCEEESCNFDLECLKDIFVTGERSYTMQNSLLRWNKEQQPSARLYETMKSSWDGSMEILELMISKLISMPSVDTHLFKITKETAEAMSQKIIKHMNSLIELVESINNLIVQKESLEKAKIVMEENLIQEKKFEIDVIPLCQNPERQRRSRGKNKSKSRWNKFDQKENLVECSSTDKKLKRRNSSLNLVRKYDNNKKKREIYGEEDSDYCDSMKNLFIDETLRQSESIAVTKYEKCLNFIDPDFKSQEMNENVKQSYREALTGANKENKTMSENKFSHFLHENDKKDKKTNPKMIKIEVTLPDNSAKYQYNHAHQESVKYEKKIEKFKKEIDKLETKLEMEFISLEDDIEDLRKLCVDFNFSNHLKDHLIEFEKKVKSCQTIPHLENYFERLMKLIYNCGPFKSEINKF